MLDTYRLQHDAVAVGSASVTQTSPLNLPFLGRPLAIDRLDRKAHEAKVSTLSSQGTCDLHRHPGWSLLPIDFESPSNRLRIDIESNLDN